MINNLQFRVDAWGKVPKGVHCEADGGCEVPMFVAGEAPDKFIIQMKDDKGQAVPARIDVGPDSALITGSGNLIHLMPGGMTLKFEADTKDPVTVTIERSTPYDFVDDSTKDRGNWVRNNFLEWMKDVD
jgi:hypothetical protein